MENRNLNRVMSFGTSNVGLECIMRYIEDPRDRDAVSLVCRRWYEIDALTRKHVTIAFCYTTTPARLRERFPNLESLKLKGKPRAAMFLNLIPEDWGGFAEPWISGIAEGFRCLKSLHFRRMIVADAGLELIAKSHGERLQSLKLDKCSGFSTDGLQSITRSCRYLRTLYLEDSTIEQKDGNWLHELALHNTVLEILNFYTTDLNQIDAKDLELIAKNCPSLVCVKIGDSEIYNLRDFFKSATSLEEFAGGSFNEPFDTYSEVIFPKTLCRLGASYIEPDMMPPMIFPRASVLKKLDLLYAYLRTEDHCQVIQRCPNLEILEARDVIGDRGLEVVSQTCRRLKRIRIERGADEGALEDEQGIVTQRGLSALAQGCIDLEYIAVHVSDISNAPLEHFGTYCRNLYDFRLVLLDRERNITELPLDNGVRALLTGCEKLRRFAFYLRLGALTDVGLRYIGQYSPNVRWMLLGCAGQTDAGFLDFTNGCPNLRKLELRGCSFSERTVALGATRLPSLRYLWVHQLFRAPLRSQDLDILCRPFWNVEVFPVRQTIQFETAGEVEVDMSPDQILAYRSLAGQRTDFPPAVVPFHP